MKQTIQQYERDLQSRIAGMEYIKPEKGQLEVYKLLVKKINNLIDIAAFATESDEIAQGLETSRLLKKSVAQLVHAGELDKGESNGLIDALTKIDAVLKKSSTQATRKEGKGIKAKMKAAVTEKKFSTIGNVLFTLTESPALMVAGQWMQARAEKKRQKLQEKIDEEKEIIDEIYKQKLKQLQKKGEVPSPTETIPPPTEPLPKETYKDMPKEEPEEIDEELEMILRQIEEELGPMVEERIEKFKKVAKSQQEIDEYIEGLKEGIEEELKLVKEEYDRQKKEKQKPLTTTPKAPQVAETTTIPEELSDLTGGLDVAGVAEELGLNPEQLKSVEEEYQQLQNQLPKAGEDIGEMVAGDLGDIYDLIGDIKDILKKDLKEISGNLEELVLLYSNTNSEEKVKARDSWSEGTFKIFQEEHQKSLLPKRQLPMAEGGEGGGLIEEGVKYKLMQKLFGAGGKILGSTALRKVLPKVAKVGAGVGTAALLGEAVLGRAPGQELTAAEEQQRLQEAREEEKNWVLGLNKEGKWVRIRPKTEAEKASATAKKTIAPVPQKTTPASTQKSVLTPPSEKTKQQMETDSPLVKEKPSIDIQGLNPDLQSNLTKAATEYKGLTGENVVVTSGKRSASEQEALYNTKPGYAAAPGTSPHEKGMAVDVGSKAANYMESTGILEKHGLFRPMAAKEPWHIEPIKAVKAGKQIGDAVPTRYPDLLRMETQRMTIIEKHKLEILKRQQQQPSHLLTQQTNIIKQKDLRFFVDDPYIRISNHFNIT